MNKETVNIEFLRYSRPESNGGADKARTCDPHNAIVVLYQLSYDPIQNAETLDCHRPKVKAIFIS